jgi:enoyl-CoA hydratase/carnithine racemase
MDSKPMDSQTDLILTATQEGILRIGFNRPTKKNAITGGMYRALTAALQEASADSAVRVVLIHGLPGAFTAGNDLADFLNLPQGEEPAALAFLPVLAAFDKPLVAAVDGLAVGIGTTLLLHCDFVYCTPEAKLSLPFINLGLVPEAASTYLLARLAGYQNAAELLMLGEPFGAARAKDIGLVSAVIEPEALMETALGTAAKLAQKPPAAMRLTKALIKRTFAHAVLQALAAENEAFGGQMRSPEAKEAMTAFFEKRKPDFSRFS